MNVERPVVERYVILKPLFGRVTPLCCTGDRPLHHSVIHGNRMQVTMCGPITAVSPNTLRNRALS